MMRRKITNTIIAILFLTLMLNGCADFQNPHKISDEENNTLVIHSIMDEDIAQAKQTMKNFFSALQNQDVDAVKDTLFSKKDAFNEIFNGNNIRKYMNWEIVSIEYPGKHGYVGPDSPPPEYKKNYGVNPYKAMSLHVKFKESGDGYTSWDFFLIQETAEDNWVIFDWGY